MSDFGTLLEQLNIALISWDTMKMRRAAERTAAATERIAAAVAPPVPPAPAPTPFRADVPPDPSFRPPPLLRRRD